mmetsp:Transcript_39120/g.101430  ORF Transcript_39120/g.101430 Transcript_39120/m.101430 type:complete len:216 (-) Transcript_39120:71-718(-)
MAVTACSSISRQPLCSAAACGSAAALLATSTKCAMIFHASVVIPRERERASASSTCQRVILVMSCSCQAPLFSSTSRLPAPCAPFPLVASSGGRTLTLVGGNMVFMRDSALAALLDRRRDWWKLSLEMIAMSWSLHSLEGHPKPRSMSKQKISTYLKPNSSADTSVPGCDSCDARKSADRNSSLSRPRFLLTRTCRRPASSPSRRSRSRLARMSS